MILKDIAQRREKKFEPNFDHQVKKTFHVITQQQQESFVLFDLIGNQRVVCHLLEVKKKV